MWIRVWNGNAIACDLTLDARGFGTWVTRPAMPNNQPGHPDLEIDPWARLIRHGRNDVEQYGQPNTVD